jgi:hypothetical protein
MALHCLSVWALTGRGSLRREKGGWLGAAAAVPSEGLTEDEDRKAVAEFKAPGGAAGAFSQPVTF